MKSRVIFLTDSGDSLKFDVPQKKFKNLIAMSGQVWDGHN